MAVFAGQWGPEPFIDRRGNAVPSAVVTVYALDGVTPAALYTDRSKATALANPLPTGVAFLAPGLDGEANGIFFAAPGGYVLSVRVGSLEVYRGTVTVPLDPIEAAAGGGGGGGAVAPLVLTSTAVGMVPLTSKGAAGQSGDLEQFQASTGAVLSRVKANGAVDAPGFTQAGVALVLTTDSRLSDARAPLGHHVSHEPGGTDPLAVDAAAGVGSLRTLGTGATQAAAGNDGRFGVPSVPVVLTSTGIGVIPLTIKAFSGQTANLLEWQDSTGAVKASIGTQGNYVYSGTTGKAIQVNGQPVTFDAPGKANAFDWGNAVSGQLLLTAKDAATTPLAVKAAGSQSGDLQQWNDSTGAVLSKVGPAGVLSVPSIKLSDNATATISNTGATVQVNNFFQAGRLLSVGASPDGTIAALIVNGEATTNRVLVVKGIAAQSADLVQWADSTGAALSKVLAGGDLLAGTTATGVRLGALGVGAGYAGMQSAGLAAGASNYTYLIQVADGAPYINAPNGGVGRIRSNGSDVITWGTTFITAQQPVQAVNASTVALIAKGSASQSVNLQEWQDSTGAVLAAVGKTGAVSGINVPVFVRKTSDQTIASSTTLTNDSALLAALVASATYRFDFTVFFDGDPAADANFALTVPAGATLQYGLVGPEYPSAGNPRPYTEVTVATASGTAIKVGTSGSGVRNMARITGIVRTGVTAGNLQLQWCQDVSNVVNNTVFADSFLSIARVA